ncbi:MAG: hypothetical protein AAF386_01185 [Pseudomonadota bacterium]
MDRCLSWVDQPDPTFDLAGTTQMENDISDDFTYINRSFVTNGLKFRAALSHSSLSDGRLLSTDCMLFSTLAVTEFLSDPRTAIQHISNQLLQAGFVDARTANEQNSGNRIEHFVGKRCMSGDHITAIVMSHRTQTPGQLVVRYTKTGRDVDQC